MYKFIQKTHYIFTCTNKYVFKRNSTYVYNCLCKYIFITTHEYIMVYLGKHKAKYYIFTLVVN